MARPLEPQRLKAPRDWPYSAGVSVSGIPPHREPRLLESHARLLQPISFLLAVACGDGPGAQPRIVGIEPNRTGVGVSVQATITGERFVAAIRTRIDDDEAPVINRQFRVRLGQRELSSDAVQQVNTEQLNVLIPPDLVAGVYDVSVGTPAGNWATLFQSFTVASGDAGDAGVVGPSGGAGAGVDGGFACTQPVDRATLALYYFQGNLDDATGKHPTSLNADASVEYVQAPEGCGTGLALHSDYRVRIDHSPDWDLETGSIDFWFLPAHTPTRDPDGILSRDSIEEPSQGHLTFYHAGSGSGRIVVRMQDGGDLFVCSDATLEASRWVHIGLNFGPPRVELYIDGVRQGYTGSVPFYNDQVSCSITGTHGISGNINPWILGASADSAVAGGDGPLRGAIEGGAINALRISSQRRPFGE